MKVIESLLGSPWVVFCHSLCRRGINIVTIRNDFAQHCSQRYSMHMHMQHAHVTVTLYHIIQIRQINSGACRCFVVRIFWCVTSERFDSCDVSLVQAGMCYVKCYVTWRLFWLSPTWLFSVAHVLRFTHFIIRCDDRNCDWDAKA